MQVVPRPMLNDCSLCMRLRGKRPTDAEGNNINVEEDALLLPEEKYQVVPWIQLKCSHYYHVHCFCRLNPAKYEDLYIRQPGRYGIRNDTVELNYQCLDCEGKRQFNCEFIPSKPSGTRYEPSTRNTYENSQFAFDRAESLLVAYNRRSKEKINIMTILDETTNLRSLQADVDKLPTVARAYLRLLYDVHPHPPFDHPFVFRQGRIIETVSYLDLLEPIKVEYDMVTMQTKEMNLRQLFRPMKVTNRQIVAMNAIVKSCKDYIAGDLNAMNDIHSSILFRMFKEPTEVSEPFCVVNRHGETKHLVTFDDFPIREPSSCSIMGGRRKTKLIRKRHQTVKNVFRRARTRL